MQEKKFLCPVLECSFFKDVLGRLRLSKGCSWSCGNILPPSVLGYSSFCTESCLNMALICAGFDLQLVVKVSEGGVWLLRATHITRVYRVGNMKGLKSGQNREEWCATIKHSIKTVLITVVMAGTL